MILKDFELVEYDEKDFEHKKAIIQLNNDANVYRFLGYIEMYINNCVKQGEKNGIDMFYIAKQNGEVIGFIALNVIGENFELSYAIVPNHRNKHLASLLLKEFSENVFEQYNYIDKLYLHINQQNTGSIKTAMLVGYQREDSTKYSKKR